MTSVIGTAHLIYRVLQWHSVKLPPSEASIASGRGNTYGFMCFPRSTNRKLNHIWAKLGRQGLSGNYISQSREVCSSRPPSISTFPFQCRHLVLNYSGGTRPNKVLLCTFKVTFRMCCLGELLGVSAQAAPFRSCADNTPRLRHARFSTNVQINLLFVANLQPCSSLNLYFNARRHLRATSLPSIPSHCYPQGTLHDSSTAGSQT